VQNRTALFLDLSILTKMHACASGPISGVAGPLYDAAEAELRNGSPPLSDHVLKGSFAEALDVAVLESSGFACEPIGPTQARQSSKRPSLYSRTRCRSNLASTRERKSETTGNTSFGLHRRASLRSQIQFRATLPFSAKWPILAQRQRRLICAGK
jgi:hypothetical protein